VLQILQDSDVRNKMIRYEENKCFHVFRRTTKQVTYSDLLLILLKGLNVIIPGEPMLGRSSRLIHQFQIIKVAFAKYHQMDQTDT